ncbi:50S ribosomal protein L29 [Gammaproteobacteria bacterium]
MVDKSRKFDKTDPIQLLLDLEKERFSMRIQKSSGQVVKNSRFSEIRKDIARAKCVMGRSRG